VPPAFLDDDFLLSGGTARVLFHEVAQLAPVADFHTHLSAADIAADRRYETLADLWLAEDHYKWRAMRLAGVDERLVSGDADPWERFRAWAATVPRLVGNPLQVWTHLELRRVFGIDLALTAATAAEIWEEANRQLPRWSARSLLAHFDVRLLATTDDPGDDLAAHAQLGEESLGPEAGQAGLRVVPTWRPDAAHRLLDDPPAWNVWVDRLEASTGVTVKDLASLLEALGGSHARFVAAGSRASDHGLDCLADQPPDTALADSVVRRLRPLGRARPGEPASARERRSLEIEVVSLAARLAYAGDNVQQLHLGARRDVSPRLVRAVGADAGADAVGDERQGPGLARFLAANEAQGRLARTVLYNSNPADNAVFASMAGSFSRAGVPSLVQWGPPWWFNDHEQGMRRHLGDLAQIGQLAGFVGMVADSRSILSMARHELFRRVLCDVIGHDVERGRVPADLPGLKAMVRGICVDNAVSYFGFASLAS
jgi:glucuronate isomerase